MAIVEPHGRLPAHASVRWPAPAATILAAILARTTSTVLFEYVGQQEHRLAGRSASIGDVRLPHRRAMLRRERERLVERVCSGKMLVRDGVDQLVRRPGGADEDITWPRRVVNHRRALVQTTGPGS